MRLKRLRQERGLTQEQLAKKVRVHRVYIAQMEAETKTPSLATLTRLAKALDVTIADLLDAPGGGGNRRRT
jgi:transcriptional regulator with XRE-family HTH domain